MQPETKLTVHFPLEMTATQMRQEQYLSYQHTGRSARGSCMVLWQCFLQCFAAHQTQTWLCPQPLPTTATVHRTWLCLTMAVHAFFLTSDLSQTIVVFLLRDPSILAILAPQPSKRRERRPASRRTPPVAATRINDSDLAADFEELHTALVYRILQPREWF